MNYSEKNDVESSLINYIIVFKKYWRFIILTTLIVGISVSLIIFFIIKPVYLSSAIIKASGKSSIGFGGLLSGSGIPDLGSFDELTGGTMVKELTLYEEILLSRRCLENVINKFDLINEFDYRFMQDAVKDFRTNMIDITKNTKSGTIEIGIYDVNPLRAKEIADYMIELLNTINTEMNVLNAKNNREFVQKRYNEISLDLKNAEDSLKDFQNKYGLAPDVVAKSVVQSEVQMEFEIKSEEIKLDLLKKILSTDQAEIKNQEAKILSLKKQLNDIRNTTPEISNLSLKGTPDVVMNYLRLVRNVEILNKMLLYIMPVYEQAKIEEKKEMPSVIVLDYPSLPEYKTKPKRLTVIGISIFATFSFMTLFFITYDMYLRKIIQFIRERNTNV